jgi:hypothetical protein
MRLNVDSRPLPELQPKSLQHQFPAPHHTGFLDALREFVCVMDASASVATLRDISLFEGYLTPSRDRGIFMSF